MYAVQSAFEPQKFKGPGWRSEAWSRDDGLVLNHAAFNGCGKQFKRQLLRNIRFDEYQDAGKDTWWDYDSEQICKLKYLTEDRLPPLLMKTVGQAVEPGDYICKGGDYDTRLVFVLRGTVEKLIGDAPAGGRCVVRRLQRGDVEGFAEFLSVGGTQQRTCALRAGPGGAHVRFVRREAVTKLLKQMVPGKEDDDDPLPRWPAEVAHFQALALDRIDALNHKASRELLYWQPLPGAERLDFMALENQSMFRMDNALGTSVSGPLPEGIEERYFLDGQTVLRDGVPGDCLIMILRGEVEALVPEGCKGQCLPRKHTSDVTDGSSWLGDGRCPTPASSTPGTSSSSGSRPAGRSHRQETMDALGKATREVAMVAIVKPADLKRAARKLSAAAEAGKLDLSDQKTTDWRWSWDDPRALQAINILQEHKLLSPKGEEKAEEVRLHQNPPKPPPPPAPQSRLGSGATVGHLALLGIPVILAGKLVAKGPVHIAVLHRHVLLEAIKDCPEADFFKPRGVSPQECVKFLGTPKARKGDPDARPANLGHNTGPPKHATLEEKLEPAAGTFSAWRSPTGKFMDVAGADALTYVLLHAIKEYALLWDLIHDAPPRLLEALLRQFEPRWLLPNEVAIANEEPDAEFLFVVIHGNFVVTLAGAEIDHMGQGSIHGAPQLLSVNDWTHTVTVTPTNRGEAMVQVLRRSKLVEVLAGHPVPKGRLRDVEDSLRDAKRADWRILQNLPAFGSAQAKPFLSRLYRDADIRLYCPGDYLAEAGTPEMSMMVVLAGTLRSEQAQTLFFVELKRGDWCFQNNILGIEPERAHDVVAVTHAMVLILYRQAMLTAIVEHPSAREAVLENETWRTEASVPLLGGLRCFEGVPAPVLSRLEKEAVPLYYKAGSVILPTGASVEEDMLLFILRGEARVSILGIETRRLGVGDSIGLQRYMGLECLSNVEIRATAPCDILAVRRETMLQALQDERYEDDLMPYKSAQRVLGGGKILDIYGFEQGGKTKYEPDCVEKSEVFKVCSKDFVLQMPKLVEELAFFPGEKLFSQGESGSFMYFVKAGRVRLEVLGRKEHEIVAAGTTLGDMACFDQVPYYTETAYAQTHVWVRALHKRLLRRALSSFPEEERRLLGASSSSEGLF